MKPITIERTIHFERRDHGARKVIKPGPGGDRARAGRVPRVARLLALAIRLDGLLNAGAIRRRSEIARLGHVTAARVCQILNLVYLAPDIQEAVLFLPLTQSGRDAVSFGDLQSIALIPEWHKQRRMWNRLQR
jgi:hypothetical protein